MTDTKKDTTGPTCLYKAGEAQVFEGADVAMKMKDGWKDTPAKPVKQAKDSKHGD